MFKWISLVSAVAFGAVIVALLISLSARANQALTQSNEALATVNESLPQIVDEAKKITHTLAVLSEDVDALKQLAGVQSSGMNRSLVAYANSVLDLLEERAGDQGARVGVERTFGAGLKDLEPAREFVVGARREATILVFRAKSQQEVLHRLSHTWSGKPFWLQLPEQDPVLLESWLRENHAESGALPPFEK